MLFVWQYTFAELVVLGGRSFGGGSFEGGHRYGGFD